MSAILKQVTDLSTARLAKRVDRAIELQRLIAPLQEELKAIKGTFDGAPDGEYTGSLGRVTVKTVVSGKLDMAEVKARLAPRDLIEATYLETSTRISVKPF